MPIDDEKRNLLVTLFHSSCRKLTILMSSWLIRNHKLLGYGPKLSLQPATVMSFVEANVSFYAVLSRNLRQMFAKPLM